MIAGMNHLQAGISYDGIAHECAGSYQRATWFNGTDSKVVISNAFTISTDFTLIWRSYTHNIDTPRYPFLWTTNFWRSLELGGQYLIQRDGGGTFSASVAFSQKAWNQIALLSVRDGTTLTISIIVNGVVIISTNYTYAPFLGDGTSQNLTIGLRGTAYFLGVIRDVAYYNRGLSLPDFISYFGGTPPTEGLQFRVVGDGNTSSNWQDQSGNGKVVAVSGSPDPAHIRGDGKIYVNGILMNP